MSFSDKLSHHISQEFNQQLSSILNRVMQMAGIVEENLCAAMATILKSEECAHNAQGIVDSDHAVNRMEVSIDEDCVQIIALRQPTASDLRFVIAAIKVTSELERIGDEAKRIARKSINLQEYKMDEGQFEAIRLLGNKTKEMLQQTLDAFARMDPDTARVIIESDKVIDQSYKVLTHKMERVMEDSCEVISQALDMIWCGRALERIGDHCKNICEQIIFFVEGQDIRYQKNRDRH